MEMTSGGKRAQNRTLSSKIISQLCFLKVLIRESHEVMNILCPTSEQTRPSCKESFHTMKTRGDGSTPSAAEQC